MTERSGHNDLDRAESLFHRALGLSAEELPGFLKRECGDDHALGALVRRMVSNHAAGRQLASLWSGHPSESPTLGNRQAASEDLAGKCFGHYRLVEMIGAGGMGVVYRAHDQHLDRDVAIKFLPTWTLADDERRGRFRREAMTLSKLNHPNVATVHDFSSENGVDYLVMEYLPGKTLRELLADGPLAIDTARSFLRQLAEGLQAAHDRGIVHRDLKPANVGIAMNGRIKILDFGLTKILKDTEDSAQPDSVDATVSFAGTPAYMSPEQLRGEPVGAATDQFSLGIVLFEMLTGQRPFRGHGGRSSAREILEAEAPLPSSVRPELPSDLDQVTRKLLAKEPTDRFASVIEVASQLRVGTEGGKRSNAQSTKFYPLLAAASVLIVVAMAAAFVRMQPAYSPPRAPARITQLTFSGHAGLPAWSTDGKYIAYTEDSGPLIIPAGGGVPRQLDLGPDWTGGGAWGWTPDASAVLVAASNRNTHQAPVVSLSILSGEATVLVENGWCPDLSTDGKTLAYAVAAPDSERGVWLADLETGERRRLIAPVDEGTAAYKPKWSPDGKRLAYYRWNGFGHELWLVTSTGEDDTRIETDPIQVSGQYSWMPDGRSLLVGGELEGLWSTWRIHTNGRGHERLTVSPTEERHVSGSPDGRRVAVRRSKDISEVVTVDVESGGVAKIPRLSVGAQHPAISPADSTLYFQVLANGRWQIWKSPLSETGTPVQLLARDGWSFSDPAADEDGVFHIRSRVGRPRVFGKIEWSQTLWWTSTDGGRHLQLELAGDQVLTLCQRVRSGRCLYGTYGANYFGVLREVRLGGEPTTVFEDSMEREFRGYDWGIDENEVLMVVRTFKTEQDTVVTFDLQSGSMSPVLALQELEPDAADMGSFNAAEIALSPDHRSLAIQGHNTARGSGVLYVYNMVARESRKLMDLPSTDPHPHAPTWATDSRHLVVEMREEESDLYVVDLRPTDGT